MNISDCKVLIVDDEVDLANLVAESFALEGFFVDKVTSGGEALERCEANHYDVIVSDQNMPGMTGFQLLEKLQNTPEKKILYYLCTGDIAIDKKDFMEIGGSDLIAKPYDIFALIERIGHDLQEI